MFKVLLCGNSSVGKTTIIKKLSGQLDDLPPVPTMSAGFASVNAKLDKEEVVMNFWDTAGQEQYRSLIKIFYRGTDVCVFVFDLTVNESFNDLNFWFKEVEDNCAGISPCGVIIGNKYDMTDKIVITDEQISEMADRNGFQWMKTSAVSDFNIEEMKKLVASVCLEKRAGATREPSRPKENEEREGEKQPPKENTELNNPNIPKIVDITQGKTNDEKKNGCC